MIKFFKVLMNKDSCSGGTHKWDLPKNGKPGAWQKLPRGATVKKCHGGFHLTTNPENWVNGDVELESRQVYLAEYCGKTDPDVSLMGGDDKIACESVRLVRLATKQELDSFGLGPKPEHKGIVDINEQDANVKIGKARGFVRNCYNVKVRGAARLAVSNCSNIEVVTDERVDILILNDEDNDNDDTNVDFGDNTKVVKLSNINEKKLPKDLNATFYQNLFKMA